MAGGKFDKLAGKTRPGTYINFQSERTDTVGTSERGTTIIPLMKPAYGPAGTYIELTNAGPDAAYPRSRSPATARSAISNTPSRSSRKSPSKSTPRMS